MAFNDLLLKALNKEKTERPPEAGWQIYARIYGSA